MRYPLPMELTGMKRSMSEKGDERGGAGMSSSVDSGPGGGGHAPRVAVFEDLPPDIEEYRRAFDKAGVEYIILQQGLDEAGKVSDEVLDGLREFKPDMFVIDFSFRTLHGGFYLMMALLKTEFAGKPFVVCSRYAEEGDTLATLRRVPMVHDIIKKDDPFQVPVDRILKTIVKGGT